MLLTELSDMWCIYIYIYTEREREVWQLPNQSLAAAKPEFGVGYAVYNIYIYTKRKREHAKIGIL